MVLFARVHAQEKKASVSTAMITELASAITTSIVLSSRSRLSLRIGCPLDSISLLMMGFCMVNEELIWVPGLLDWPRRQRVSVHEPQNEIAATLGYRARFNEPVGMPPEPKKD
jgi:hypothetical protein